MQAAPPLSADPWAQEDEREALSRRYGHLDLDRGTFDALFAPELGTGAKVAVMGGVVAGLGALAWWLWPESPATAATARVGA